MHPHVVSEVASISHFRTQMTGKSVKADKKLVDFDSPQFSKDFADLWVLPDIPYELTLSNFPILDKHTMQRVKIVETPPSTLICLLDRLFTCLCQLFKHLPHGFASNLKFLFGQDVSNNSHAILCNILLHLVNTAVVFLVWNVLRRIWAKFSRNRLLRFFFLLFIIGTLDMTFNIQFCTLFRKNVFLLGFPQIHSKGLSFR